MSGVLYSGTSDRPLIESRTYLLWLSFYTVCQCQMLCIQKSSVRVCEYDTE